MGIYTEVELEHPVLSGGEGKLSVVVWPVYVGVALEGETPPFSINEPNNGGYERGTILWRPVDDWRQVIGRAQIICPPGVYTHFVYFHHPTRREACGVTKIDHPLRFAELTVLVVDPIENQDLRLAKVE